MSSAAWEYYGPKSRERVRKNAGTTSSAHTTQKSGVKRNGRSMACMGMTMANNASSASRLSSRVDWN